jgi:dimeric dUTPase (all-alpha-NTP-PPase superfamily)
MEQQIITMLELQDEMNEKVHSEWRKQNFAWYRAIWIESAELMDHYGWKWWKKQSPDKHQITLELVDIWHFGLSLALIEHNSISQSAQRLKRDLDASLSSGEFRKDIEDFAAHTLKTKRFDARRFGRLMNDIEMTFESLYVSYVGKNVLNFFRQDHGYQNGTYRKTWGAKEDNEILVEIIERLDPASSSFRTDLYGLMENEYALLSA